MQRKSYIQQHPHQEMRRGHASYASMKRIKSTPNEMMDFQIFARGLDHKDYHYTSEDEDSDEQTIYFAKKKKRNQLR